MFLQIIRYWFTCGFDFVLIKYKTKTFLLRDQIISPLFMLIIINYQCQWLLVRFYIKIGPEGHLCHYIQVKLMPNAQMWLEIGICSFWTHDIRNSLAFKFFPINHSFQMYWYSLSVKETLLCGMKGYCNGPGSKEFLHLHLSLKNENNVLYIFVIRGYSRG